MALSDAVYAGMVPNGQKYSANTRLGQVFAPPIEFIMDDRLPPLGQDPHNNYLNRDFVVIPAGRIVAVKATDLTRLSGKTVLTLANGVDPLNAPTWAEGNLPFGYAPYKLFRNFAGLKADAPLGVNHEVVELPYTSINESYNHAGNGGARLKAGEWLMPYYGSANAKQAVAVDRGKLVRYVPKALHRLDQAGAGTATLALARFPAFVPKIILALAADGSVVTEAPTLDYSEAADRWVATWAVATTVTTVIYEYGADEGQRIGQVLGIEPIGTAGGINVAKHELHGWLKWVQDAYGNWDFPPMLNHRDAVDVVDEVVVISAANTGSIANAPIVPRRKITVKVTGTLTHPDGTEEVLTLTEMDYAEDNFFGMKAYGKYYSIDILTGAIEFTSNIAVTTCKVSYSYEVDFRRGMSWDARGITGLTDGSGGSGVVGTPAHLDVPGVLGALRVAIQA